MNWHITWFATKPSSILEFRDDWFYYYLPIGGQDPDLWRVMMYGA